MVKDKVRGSEKYNLVTGGVCGHGILWRIRRIGVAIAIVEGNIIFLGRDTPTKNTTHNAHVEGGF